MSKYFFSDGMMPSDKLPLLFQHGLVLANRWRWNGTHYEKTADAWLANMDAKKNTIIQLFEMIYGKDNAAKWWMRWAIRL